MPLRTIGAVLDADNATRASVVRTYWDGVEQILTERRNLVAYLCSRLEGTTMTTHDVTLRAMPERHLASINPHVLTSETDAFFSEAFATLRSTGPGLEGIAGCPFLVFYGEVQTRIEAAHDEMYVRLSKGRADWAGDAPLPR